MDGRGVHRYPVAHRAKIIDVPPKRIGLRRVETEIVGRADAAGVRGNDLPTMIPLREGSWSRFSTTMISRVF